MRPRSCLVPLLVLPLIACSGGDTSCPPDYPVLRDGFCYAEDGGGRAMDAGPAFDGGGTGTDSGDGTDGAIGDEGGVICNGTHPLLDGGARFCAPSDCFCADPDNCFPAEVAAACCSVDVTCAPAADGGTADGGGDVICPGTHPLLDGGARFCGPGDCFCADPDSCFPADVAAACCLVDVTCT